MIKICVKFQVRDYSGFPEKGALVLYFTFISNWNVHPPPVGNNNFIKVK